jgi:hypothetical protein
MSRMRMNNHGCPPIGIDITSRRQSGEIVEFWICNCGEVVENVEVTGKFRSHDIVENGAKPYGSCA